MPPHPERRERTDPRGKNPLEKKAWDVWKSVQVEREFGAPAPEPDAIEMASRNYMGYEGRLPLQKGDWLEAEAAESIMREHRLHEGRPEDTAQIIVNLLRKASSLRDVLGMLESIEWKE